MADTKSDGYREPSGPRNATEERQTNAGCKLHWELQVGPDGQVGLWQTPAVDSFRSRGGDRKDEMGLDHKRGSRSSQLLRHGTFGAKRGGAATMSHFNRPSVPTLPAMIEHSFLPDQQTEMHGEKSSQTALTSRRRLNTKFVEWLMGLPEGWTSPAPINSADLGIWSSHSREHLRCLFSSIETPKGSSK